MSFIGDALHEMGPLLRVSAEDEERCLHTARRERVEHNGCRVGIGTVVERERDGAIVRRQATDWTPEDRAVAIEGTVRGAAQKHGADT